jgi:hypothetical protein
MKLEQISEVIFNCISVNAQCVGDDWITILEYQKFFCLGENL